MSSLLNGLNATQRQAAEHRAGPLLILAAAGSGKTRTITHRAAYLVQQGVPSNRILVVTFTNKAARELQERLDALLGNEHHVWTMTFHALCLRILRESGDLIGIKKNFTIFDISDAQKTIKKIYCDLGYHSPTRLSVDERKDENQEESERQEISRIRNAISRYKNEGLTPQAIANSDRSDLRRTARIWERYETTLAQMNMLDFDDLMRKAAQILDTPEGKARWGTRFQHVMIDEYQDTNGIQDTLARHLASNGNLCVVGDDSQSIYSWRGANVENILTFAKRWPNCSTVKLEHNYRSQANIIACAESVISHATQRTDKTTRPVKPAGAPVRIVSTPSDEAEAQFVAKQIKTLRDGGTPGHEIAVLYRNKQQSRAIQYALRNLSVEFGVVGDIEFNRRSEVQSVRAYVALLANPNDAHAFSKAVAFPRRGVGQAAVDKVLEAAHAAHDGNVLKAASGLLEAGSIKGKARTGLHQFLALLQDAAAASSAFSLGKILKAIISVSGLSAQLAAGDKKQRSQIENIHQLLEITEKYLEPANVTIPEFLEATSLRDLSDQHQDSHVTLMTVHATKGMEFDHVYFTGFEEEILNYEKMSPQENDEDIRLVYVGLTRAREHLTLTHADQRSVWGKTQNHRPASFVHVFPTGTAIRQRYPAQPGTNRPRSSAITRSPPSVIRQRRPAARTARHHQSQDVAAGERVRHSRFGVGDVKRVVGDRITVTFPSGQRTLLANHAALEKVS